MRYPEFLKDSGSIGFIAPSFGCATEPYFTRFNEAAEKFNSLGYRTILGSNCYENSGIGKSNTPQKCAEEINDFFINGKSDVIISCGGGETMCEDLQFVDFAGIAEAAPRWFMGYSDNTYLTYTLPVLCDTAAVYGPCAASFGMKEWHNSINDAFDILKGDKFCLSSYNGWERYPLKDETNPLAGYNITEPSAMKIKCALNDSVSFSGRLIGGCLDCLQILVGTKYDKTGLFADKYSDDGIIWFLESCDMNPMDVRRALWQLDNAGWFQHVSGFIFGRPLHFGEEMLGMNHNNAVTGELEKYNVPIILNADIGHLPPMMPLIAGSFANVSASEDRLTVDMRLV